MDPQNPLLEKKNKAVTQATYAAHIVSLYSILYFITFLSSIYLDCAFAIEEMHIAEKAC